METPTLWMALNFGTNIGISEKNVANFELKGALSKIFLHQPSLFRIQCDIEQQSIFLLPVKLWSKALLNSCWYMYILSINKHSFVFRWHFSPFSLRNRPSPFCIVIEKPEIEEEHPARIGSHDYSNEKRFTRNILHLIESQGPSPRVQSKKRAIFSGKKFQWVFHHSHINV